MRWLLVITIMVSALTLSVPTAAACTIIPHRFEPEAISEHVGLVHGRVISSTGRFATFEVLSYVGPKKVQPEVTLGPTIQTGIPSSPGSFNSCQGYDPSLVFYEGQEWLLIVRVDESGWSLMNPRGRTGMILFDQGQVRLDESSPATTPAREVMERFAQANSLTIQRPGTSSPPWPWALVVAATVPAAILLIRQRRSTY